MDSDLRALLISELRKQEAVLCEPEAEVSAALRALHAVKGSAGLAGERALCEAFTRVDRRARAGDREALAQASAILASAIANLEQGLPAYEDSWPVPPPDLSATNLPSALARHGSEMHDRIARLDEVLRSSVEPLTAMQEALRHVHTLKGAASSVGDDTLLWFCHGLEGHLREGANQAEIARARLADLPRWRSVLSQLVDDPARAIASLRSATARAGPTTRPPEATPPPPRTDSSLPHPPDSSLRVSGTALDRVLERLGRLSLFADEYRAQAQESTQLARRLRDQRASLQEALHLIGPSKPWGAPAAALAHIESAVDDLGSLAALQEGSASKARQQAHLVRQDLAASQTDLGAMRQTTMESVFEPARSAVETLALREGRLVSVVVSGASLPVDRRLAEALVDPVLQLARNALAHGIEPPGERRAAGKPEVGTIALSAEVRGVHLVVTVHDDGAGVNSEAVRRCAAGFGVLGALFAEEADDELLMNLLFVPGLTTIKEADALAGRGVGLDLAQHAVRQLGGTIRILNRPGHGLEAVLDVPLRARGVVSVLWVTSLAHTFALLSSNVLRVHPREDSATAPPLAYCLDPKWVGQDLPGYVLEVGRERPGDSVRFCVASVGLLEQAVVRPVSPLIATAGPYVGVIVGRSGIPALLVDPLKLGIRS